ncbi:MAG: DUF3093 family protein [Actinobacteria bacterium]|nr:DUF3093 family protein [Actinomycetota bacterium]MSX99843.1 DUF3093 family protein [Actinomycetota bacterium]MTA49136.1 DUF3093 family protein [Actinomycetota bacterium]MTA90910.1 DUF3093 family protein [Actinomycetota bacterium]
MIFREVLRPPIWVLAFIYFLFLSVVLSVWAAFDNRATMITLAISTLALIWIAIAMQTVITFDGQTLRIDKANIESQYLGKVTLLDKTAMRLLRTRDADPAAYLAIKFWEPSGLRIDLNDPRDKTPYWLITSKRGEEIAALLNR